MLEVQKEIMVILGKIQSEPWITAISKSTIFSANVDIVFLKQNR